MAAPTPTPGHPIRRNGKPYIWVTWLSGLLGGKQCLWSVWFKAHFKYDKFETQGEELAQWNREHTALIRERRVELEENGWTVFIEDQNDFKLEGQAAVVAGKPDLVATLPGEILVVDGKTGRERDSDWWQVLFYLYALPKSRPDLVGKLRGEIHYKRDDKRIAVRPTELTPVRLNEIVTLIKAIGGPTPPAKAPSRHECEKCNIRREDCPARFQINARQAVPAVGDF